MSCVLSPSPKKKKEKKKKEILYLDVCNAKAAYDLLR